MNEDDKLFWKTIIGVVLTMLIGGVGVIALMRGF